MTAFVPGYHYPYCLLQLKLYREKESTGKEYPGTVMGVQRWACQLAGDASDSCHAIFLS